ncbi:predicted protein [Nematostella vectensis]|uniref:EGF-like domain-containing protein n=1 Tax=Nematostella vectensis TaxID=45351 RepID=A7RU36_NEMVE|nr:predicted protein [Nematostella vectensis]|eukprot:XP_001637080.1 predicted protein [Nematostella vectensis]
MPYACPAMKITMQGRRADVCLGTQGMDSPATGFIGEGDLCTDIDECHQKAHLCNKNALCHNIPGSYKCMCLKGYHGDDCHDANECERGEHTCSKNAMCINTSGSYECVCNDGYRGNGTICEIPSPGKRHNAGDHHRLDGYLFVHIVIFYLFIGCW